MSSRSSSSHSPSRSYTLFFSLSLFFLEPSCFFSALAARRVKKHLTERVAEKAPEHRANGNKKDRGGSGAIFYFAVYLNTHKYETITALPCENNYLNI